jgi:hypothetical protein
MRRHSASVCLYGSLAREALREQRQEQEHQEQYAYFQSIGAKRPQAAAVQDGKSGLAGMSAKARCLHPRLHPDPEEAELGAA